MAELPFGERLRRAAEEVAVAGLDGLLISPSPNLVYLAGYSPMALERLTMLLVVPGRRPLMLVPVLERALAEESPTGSSMEIAIWSDGEDPYAAAAKLLPSKGRLAADDRMWAAHLLGLQRALPGVAFVPAGGVLSRLRAVKDPHELELLGRAGRAADEVFRRICGTRFEGRREEEIAAELAALLVETGHDRANFAIVASGPDTASPHHAPGLRTIRPGDAVVMDFGGELSGYFSDTTRTVCVGGWPDGFDGVYEVVKEAQDAAFRSVAPGVPAQDVDRAARVVIQEAGFADRFIHRTGHGIGLELHEHPYIVEGNTEALREGMCFSIEPGIYLPGKYGARIEDIVAVTKGGAVRLNHSPRELQIVD